MVEALEFFQTILAWLGIYLLVLITSLICAVIAFPYILNLVTEADLVKPNYRNENIPAMAGLIFVVLIPLITGVGMILGVKSFTTNNSFLFLFVIVGMGFLGLIDDRLGGHEVKGFRGHFYALWRERRLTTGGFKAIFGAIIAMVFSIGSAFILKAGWQPWNILINFFLVVLAANSINLFDLRPGRAGKIYITGFILITAFSKNFEAYLAIFLPILAIMLYYLPFDLQAKVMMGDVGSNLLGASLGMMMAWMFSDFSKIIALIILLGLQVVAERYSFTEIIERNSWLKYLDQIGRGK